jgi:hypothetical protein
MLELKIVRWCVYAFFVSRNNNKQNRFKYTTHGISRNKKLCCGSASLSLPLTHSLTRVVKRYTWKRKKSSSWFFSSESEIMYFYAQAEKMHWCNAMLWVFLRTHIHEKVEGESGCVFYRWWLLYHMRSNAKLQLRRRIWKESTECAYWMAEYYIKREYCDAQLKHMEEQEEVGRDDLIQEICRILSRLSFYCRELIFFSVADSLRSFGQTFWMCNVQHQDNV